MVVAAAAAAATAAATGPQRWCCDLLRFGYGGEPDTDPVRMRRRRAEAAEDRHALSAVTALLARHDLGRAYRARVRYDRVGTNDSLGYPLAVGANNNTNHRHPSRVAPHAVHSERTVAVIPVGGGEAAGEARKKLRTVLRQFRAESEEARASFATSGGDEQWRRRRRRR